MGDQGAADYPELDAVRQAIADALAAIESMPDHDRAFRTAGAYVDLLSESMRAAAVARAQIATEIAARRGLSQSQLGAELGVSKARAEQLLNAAKKASGAPPV